MNFYLNYLHEKISLPDENPPVGMVLCADKDAEEVHYATGNLDHQVFVSRVPDPTADRRATSRLARRRARAAGAWGGVEGRRAGAERWTLPHGCDSSTQPTPADAEARVAARRR
jgi:hypothetical protein